MSPDNFYSADQSISSRARPAATTAAAAIVALLLSFDAACAQDTSFGQRLYQDKADCQFCHGPKGDGRGDPRSPGKAPNLHQSKLNRDQPIEVIGCGRPATEMPHFDKYAYDDKACYGLSAGDLGKKRSARSTLDAPNEAGNRGRCRLHPGNVRRQVGRPGAAFRQSRCCFGPQATGTRKVRMKRILTAATLICLMEVTAMADKTARFETDAVGAAPAGWTATSTGKGDPKWTVEQDQTALSKFKIVKQSGRAPYPLLLKDDTTIKDGFIAMKFKAIAGSEDRAAGLVWRASDAGNYYVVRANALEDNVVLYNTVNGVRSPLDIVGRKGGYGIDVPVPANQWHDLRIEFGGSRFRVIYNGKQLFEVEDSTFSDAGKVGLWTKADSVTLFDEINYGEAK